MADNHAWLALTREDALEPALPIVDPHHHLWHFPEQVGSLAGSLTRRYPEDRYLLEELLADTGEGHNVVATVFVECTAFYRAHGPQALRPVGETEFVNGQAAMAASGRYGDTLACAGIVGMADLTLPPDTVDEVLAAHIAAGNGRFRGIRHAAGWDESDKVRNSHTNPPPHLYLDDGFRAGFARLATHGLSFDAWLYHPQNADVTALARAFPETTVILDHVGGPLGIGPYEGKRDEIFPVWKATIEEMAACPNVTVKLGGLAMTICGFNWHKLEKPPSSAMLADAWRPYLETCIAAFGPERCMFESNFPVDKASTGYGVLWNAFKRIAAGASADEKRALFHDTAARVYRLDLG
jgi:L-fuconolactonase